MIKRFQKIPEVLVALSGHDDTCPEYVFTFWTRYLIWQLINILMNTRSLYGTGDHNILYLKILTNQSHAFTCRFIYSWAIPYTSRVQKKYGCQLHIWIACSCIYSWGMPYTAKIHGDRSKLIASTYGGWYKSINYAFTLHEKTCCVSKIESEHATTCSKHVAEQFEHADACPY